MIAKTDTERDILREGGRDLARYLRILGSLVAPGVTSLDIENKACELIAADGNEPSLLNYRPEGAARPYPAATCVSVNDEIVHKIPNENVRTFKEGDVVSIDLTITHKGLMTDATVTVIAGAADPADERLIRGTREAIEAGIAAARCGNTTGDIGHAIQAVANKYGFGFPPELAGHGVGRSVHEPPYVPNFGRPGEGTKLVDGMVIAIEPMFARGSGRVVLGKDGYAYRTKDGSRTAHIEHTVLITKEGTEILTQE